MVNVIAGGAGFIGINLVSRLIKENKRKNIYIIDNFSNSSKKLFNDYIQEQNVKLIECNIDNLEELDKIFQNLYSPNEKINLWHLAANSDIATGTSDKRIDFRDTFLTTFNLLEICKKYDIKSFFFASSSAIYGDHDSKIINENTGPLMPKSNYGAMKLASEALCFSCYENFLDTLRIFRFPNVVGTPATHGVINDFFIKLNNNENLLKVLGDGNQEKSYLHVTDLVDAMFFLSEITLHKGDNPIFNLGPNNDSVKVKWIAEEVVKYHQRKVKILYGEERYGWIGDIPKFYYDTSKATKYGWTPILNSKESIKKAICEIGSTYKKNF